MAASELVLELVLTAELQIEDHQQLPGGKRPGEARDRDES